LESPQLSGNTYRFERRFFLRDFRRIVAMAHPAAVRKTPTVTTKVIATTKATTAGTEAAIADGFLSRINVQFNLLRPSLAQFA